MDIRPPRRKVNKPTAVQSAPVATTDTQSIPLKNSERPSGKKMLLKLKKVTLVHGLKVKKKNLLFLAFIIVATGGVTFLVISKKSNTKPPVVTNESKLIENLEYQTVVPEGKAIGDLGGWKRVSPPENDPVYAYADNIGEVAISVSQQPIPGAFIGDLDNRVTKLAKEYNATTLIYADGIKVYIGTSSKGPQSTIFTKNNLLILIKSEKKIDEESWVKYIEALD